MARKKGELGNAIRNARLRKQAEIQGGASGPPPGGEAPTAAPGTHQTGHPGAHARQEKGHAERGRSHRDRPHR